MRRLSSSRARRNAACRVSSDPLTPDGSSIDQCRRLRALGKTGQVLFAWSQTVMTSSNFPGKKRSSAWTTIFALFENCPYVVSHPLASHYM